MLATNNLSGFGGGGGAARADMSDAPQSNLIIHSRADVGITESGDSISAWGNSGSGADWGSITNPTWVESGTVGGLANAGYIQFDGSNDHMLSNANNGSNTAHHFFLVMMVDTWKSAGQVLNSKGGSATHLLIKGSEGSPLITPECDGAPYPTAAFTIGEWMLVDCMWAPTAPNAHIKVDDGAENNGGGSFGGSGWSTSMDLMAANHGAAYLHGKVAEILAYNGEQTGSTLTAIVAYLNGQYSIF
jgi:hypothetical protein